MGLAASQARFLGLTARKANCEFKSTELAEEKLDLTNQLARISNEYYDSMNATKLVWKSDVVDGTYGVSYGLLMSPSALNDYNPYMVTTRSGAIVLTDEYVKAAQAAGISMGGGAASEKGRDIFINNLINAGIITEETAKIITNYDYDKNAVNKTSETSDKDKDAQAEAANNNRPENTPEIKSESTGYISYDSAAGVGGSVINKNEVDAMTISDLMLSEAIGKKSFSFDSFVNTSISGASLSSKYNNATDAGKEALITYYNISDTDKNTLANDGILSGSYTPLNESGYKTAITTLDNKISQNITDIGTDPSSTAIDETALNDTQKAAYNDYIHNIGVKAEMESLHDSFKISSDGGSNINEKVGYCTLIENGTVLSSSSAVNGLTISDLLSDNIVLMVRSKKDGGKTSNSDVSTADFSNAVMELMRPVFETFGYGDATHTVGLNTDDTSNEALNYAFKMIQNVYLRSSNAYIKDSETKNTPSKNSAYDNATKTNRIAQDEKGLYTAVSLSNILSAFLTYYGNYTLAQAGEDSAFSVQKMVDSSKYVTEDPSYIYLGQSTEYTLKTEDKIADFYDQLYNNLCRHGWRQDETLNNDESLTSAIQDGRYTLSSLYDDGYFYQTNYLNIDYLTEVTDDDAIAKAEADYTRKKAEITYKENSIDIKTKKLDAEIAAINQEINSVSTLIQNGIKVFDMFKS